MSYKYFTFIIFFTFLININKGRGQYYDLGQEPAKLKWKQIDTKDFRILFTDDFSTQAKRLASYLSNVVAQYPGTIGHKPDKINIIIHNRSVISNAYAAWTPSRMEFFTSVPQTTYSQDWLEQLCLHEYRHISQMDKMKTGAGKYLYYLFGQQATAALFGLFVPSWFMEGDAVCTETAFSNSGRGRVPDFEMPLKAQYYEKGLFSFDKTTLGSFKDYVPSEYTFGYLFLAANRIKYDANLWNNVTSFIANKPYTLTPLSKGLKKYSGKNTKSLYRESFNFLDSIWKNSKKYEPVSYDDNFISPVNKNYTSYEQTAFINDSVICTVKNGLDYERQFVIVSSGEKEKKLHIPGFFNPVRLASSGESIIFSDNKKFEELLFTANNKCLVWSEVEYDKRWTHRTWSVIKTYNFEHHKVKKLTRHTKYFAPAISPNNKIIAVSEILPEYKFSIVFIDANTGNELKRFSLPGNNILLTPSWSPDNKDVLCVYLDNKGEKGILKINYETLAYQVVLSPSNIEISKPISDENFIFYNAVYDGISNIYALNPENSKIYRVSSSKYGASWASISPDRKNIAFSEYTANGYRTIVIPYDTSKWIITNPQNTDLFPMADNLGKQEIKIKNASSYDTTFTIKKYKKIPHLFNFHSWLPAAYGNLPDEVFPGITLMSQNHLSNTFLILNTGYNYYEKRPFVNSSLVYKGWYPIIELKQHYGGRRSYFDDYITDKKIDFTWNESITELQLSLPLNFTSGRWFRNFKPDIGIENIALLENNQKPDSVLNNNLQAAYIGFDFRNLIKTSERDLKSRFGQILTVNYIKSLNSTMKGEQFSINAAVLLPGLMKHHSLKLSYGYQYVNAEKYCFPLITKYPRGFISHSDYKLDKYMADYHFPLLYPDLNLAGFVYIKRIKTNLFCDYARGKNKNEKYKEYLSTGAEITFDIIPVRAMMPADIGFRYIYIPKENKNAFEFMLSLNFDSF